MEILPYKHAKYVTYPNVRKKEYIITDQGTIIDLVYKRVVRYYLDKDGYMRVSLRVENPTSSKPSMNFGIHRLVAWEFCDNDDPEVKRIVNHMDGRVMHNESTNLEWTTVAGNTQHADDHNMRNTQGDKNVTSIYNENFVHRICSLYEQGYEPMDVYHKFFGYSPLRSKADKSVYTLLYTLKKKAGWPHITSQYNYPIEINRRRTEKVFLPKASSLFSEENVRWICKQLENGVTVPELANMAMDLQMPNFDPGEHTKRHIRDSIGRIYRGDAWRNISCEYNIPSVVYDLRGNETRFNEAFRQMIDQGMLQSAIIKTVSKEFNVSQNYVRFNLQKYLREHGFETAFNSYKKNDDENAGSQMQ